MALKRDDVGSVDEAQPVPAALARTPLTEPGSSRFRNAVEVTGALVRRDLIGRYRRTFLGVLWSLVPPLFTLGIYYFIFVIVARASPTNSLHRADGDAIPVAVFMYCGLAIWGLFATSVGTATLSVMCAGAILQRLWFPRAVLPLASVLGSLIGFAFELCVLVVMVGLTVGPFSLQLLWLPVILATVLVLSYGVSLLLSGAAVFLRDLSELVTVLLRLLVWVTPTVYALDVVAHRPLLLRFIEANPMTGIVVAFRNVVLLNRPPNFELLAYSAICSVVAFAVGWLAFHRWQRLFPELT